MNILIEGGDLNPPFAEGTRNIAITYAKALLNEGHKVCILTRKKCRITNKKLKKYEVIEGIKFYRWSNYLDLLFLYKKVIEKEKIEIIHIFAKGIRNKNYFRILKLMKNRPFIFSLLGLPSYSSEKKGIKKVIRSLKIIDLILVPSKSIFSELEKNGLKNIKYLPYGIDLKKFRPRKITEARHILCIRPPSKELLKGFKRINMEFKNTKLVLNKSILSKNIEKSIIKNKVDNIIWIKIYKDSSKLYKNVEIMIDLHNNKKHLECASPPAAILEAMACKIKVISTNIPEIREIITNNNGYLVNNNESEEIYNKIKKALNNKNKIISNARKTIENNYSLKRILPKYIKIYKKIIKHYNNKQ